MSRSYQTVNVALRLLQLPPSYPCAFHITFYADDFNNVNANCLLLNDFKFWAGMVFLDAAIQWEEGSITR